AALALAIVDDFVLEWPALFLDSWTLDLPRLVFLIVAGHRVLELANPLPERASHLGQPLRAEDDQRDHEHDQDLWQSNVGHLLPSSRLRKWYRWARLQPANPRSSRCSRHLRLSKSRLFLK